MNLSIQCKQAEVVSQFYSNGSVWVTLREVEPQSIDIEPIIDARLDDIMQSLMKDREFFIGLLGEYNFEAEFVGEEEKVK